MSQRPCMFEHMFGVEQATKAIPLPANDERGPRLARGILPEGVDDIAPGADLARLLEDVDRTGLNGYELVQMVEARSRLIAHFQAEFHSDIMELALTPAGDVDSDPDRLAAVDALAVEELQAALTLTQRAAQAHLNLACGLARLPAVSRLLRDGAIDLARARVICAETAHLDNDQLALVVDPFIAQAPHLTAAQLGARLRRRCVQVDAESARRRYRQGIDGRRLDRFANPDGTADLLGRQLPIDRVAAIYDRINMLARQLLGCDERTLDQIRADIVLDLLDGRHHAASRRGVINLHIDLTTLIGLDDNPAEIPGWGPVISDIARQIVDRRPDQTWRYVITDPDTNHPTHTGVTRRRPTTAQRRHVEAHNPTCVFPGCRRPATDSHLDHTFNHAHGRPTHLANLGPLCSPHHLTAKHKAGWRLTQPRPGTFHWTSPRGHHYLVTPPEP